MPQVNITMIQLKRKNLRNEIKIGAVFITLQYCSQNFFVEEAGGTQSFKKMYQAKKSHQKKISMKNTIEEHFREGTCPGFPSGYGAVTLFMFLTCKYLSLDRVMDFMY